MQRTLAVVMLAIGCHASAAAPAPPPAAAATVDDSAEDSSDDPEDSTDVLPAVAPTGSMAGGGAVLLAEAQRELAAVRTTTYAHHTHVDEATGAFDFDCSGFVGYALAHVAAAALHAVQAQTKPRPLAKHFEAVFASTSTAASGAANDGPWLRVERVRDMLPGDVIAWLEPPVKHSRNTGHVMIAASAPTAGARDGEYIITVIDSSHSGHGKRDARIREHRNGLGTGDIVLLVDGDDHPVGYRWSTWSRSTRYRTEVAIGRTR